MRSAWRIIRYGVVYILGAITTVLVSAYFTPRFDALFSGESVKVCISKPLRHPQVAGDVVVVSVNNDGSTRLSEVQIILATSAFIGTGTGNKLILQGPGGDTLLPSSQDDAHLAWRGLVLHKKTAYTLLVPIRRGTEFNRQSLYVSTKETGPIQPPVISFGILSCSDA